MAYTFIFFGIAGSGKGTQIELLKNYLNKKDKKEIVYAGTGEGFRKLINANNYTSYLIKDSLDRGELQPDFFATSIVVDILAKDLGEEKNLITDGYPRTINQSKIIEEMMKFWRRDNIDIIYIKLDREEAMQRNLKRGRTDDNKEALNKRFDEFYQNVIPSMEYFNNKENYRIHIIEGNQGIEKVHEDIIKSLNI